MAKQASQKPGRIDPPNAIRQAAALHQQGRLDDAEKLYAGILRAKHDHFDALHLLGVLMHQRGRSVEALALIQRALAQNAKSAAAHANQGRVLVALRRPDEALASFGQALALQPDQPEFLFHRAGALIGLGRFADALADYDRLLTLRSDHVDALVNRAVVLRELKRPAEAVESLDRALALKPDHAIALANCGNALLDLDRVEDALASFDRAVAAKADSAEAHYNRGNALLRLERFAEAVASYDNVIALKAGHAEALANRGVALLKLRRPADTLASYEQALALKPDHAEVLSNRGNALIDLNRPAEALASIDRALALRPDYAEALVNRGNALMELRRPADALDSYTRALALSPNQAEAHWNRSLAWLTLGDFLRGWPEYEWRMRRANENYDRGFAQPQWTGEESLAGKTILLHAEQGFGDTIQFVRYAPMVAALGGSIILEVQRPLLPLLTGLDGMAAVIARGDELPAFERHCPLLSLPLAFETALGSIPADVPYLSAPEDRVTKWRERLGEAKGLRVGVAWSGNPAVKNDHNRSMPLERFASILSVPGIEFVSIQKDIRESDRAILQNLPQVLALGGEFADFADTAAAISLLDLVITTDTAVAHLAGALGKPLWLLLAYNCDWRWMLDREDSSWYPAARLFRQPGIGDWESVLARVRSELEATAASR